MFFPYTVREKEEPSKGVNMSFVEETERRMQEESDLRAHARDAWLFLVQRRGPIRIGLGRTILNLLGNPDDYPLDAFRQLEDSGKLEEHNGVVGIPWYLQDANIPLMSTSPEVAHTRDAWILLVQVQGSIPLTMGYDILELGGHSNVEAQYAFWNLQKKGELEFNLDTGTVSYSR